MASSSSEEKSALLQNNSDHHDSTRQQKHYGTNSSASNPINSSMGDRKEADIRGHHHEHFHAETYKRRWWLLGVFSITALAQSTIWNTWSPITDSVLIAFDWTNSFVTLFPALANLGYAIFAFPLMYLVETHGKFVTIKLYALLWSIKTPEGLQATSRSSNPWLQYLPKCSLNIFSFKILTELVQKVKNNMKENYFPTDTYEVQNIAISDSVMLCYKMAVPYCAIPVGLQIRMMLCVVFLNRFEIWNGCCRIFTCTEHCVLEHRSRYSPRLVRELLVSYLTYILFLLLTMSTTTVSRNQEKYLKISDLNFC